MQLQAAPGEALKKTYTSSHLLAPAKCRNIKMLKFSKDTIWRESLPNLFIIPKRGKIVKRLTKRIA